MTSDRSDEPGSAPEHDPELEDAGRPGPADTGRGEPPPVDQPPAVAAAPRGRAVFTHTQVFGLLLVAGAFVFAFAAEFAFSGTEALASLAFIGVPLAVVLIVTGLAWRFGTWAKVLGVVIALALLVLFAPFLVGALFTFDSVFDFLPALAVIVGALIAVVAGIAAVVRRSLLVIEITPVERGIRTAGLVILLVLGLASGVATYLGIDRVEEADAAGAAEVEMEQFEFVPDTVEVESGETSIVVRNRDHVLHTFTVDELDVDVTVTPFSDGLVTIDAEPGTYRIYCRPHSDPDVEDDDEAGMVATLEVGD